ncbi:MAG: hypothetical protein ACRD3L_02100 [Terriglobales bacterium]
MADEKEINNQIDQFVLDEIDSVPHLEALLLLWAARPREWSPKTMAKALYVDADFAGRILKDLSHRNLAAGPSGTIEGYTYNSTEERDGLVRALDAVYRREIVRISTLIHSKGSPAMREFAKAFRFTKDRGQ